MTARGLLVALLVVLPLSGCASLPANPTVMTPGQLKEWVKDKTDYVFCGTMNSPWGRGIATYVSVDKGVSPNTSITVDSECKTTINNTSPAKPQ